MFYLELYSSKQDPILMPSLFLPHIVYMLILHFSLYFNNFFRFWKEEYNNTDEPNIDVLIYNTHHTSYQLLKCNSVQIP